MSWLSIVGIGEDGLDGLGLAARRAIAEAELVFGGVRHLDLAGSVITGEKRPWLTPFSASIDAILAVKGKKVCVLASGDPFHYGVGATLSRHVDASQMAVYPQSSAFSLAAARLGWPLQDVICLSLHGRSLDLLRPHLHAGARILALTSDEHGPAAIAALMTDAGFGIGIISVLEALGGPREKVRAQMAMSFALKDVDPLNICAISVAALPTARVLSLAPGLDDALFEHDGQITKREIRAVTLSALAPRRGELLWDIGAGSGSIGIEWMLADPSMRAIGIETDAERAERARRNALLCGVPDLQIINGTAPGALAGLPQPNAVFIGGGGSQPGVMEAAIAALPPGGRLVANGVTLEMEALLLARHAELGGNLIRLDVTRAAPVGGMTGWRPAMPVVQWSWTRPW